MSTTFKLSIEFIEAEHEADIKVGPVGNSYAYQIGAYSSKSFYHNAASARADARRLQLVTWAGELEPVPEGDFPCCTG
jgi:hypothetical protein